MEKTTKYIDLLDEINLLLGKNLFVYHLFRQKKY